MIKSEFSNKLTEQAFKNFENIQQSLKGLFEIMQLARDDGEDFQEIYYNLGVDNISGLYENLLELLFNDYGARQVMKALRNSEIDLAIPLNDPIKGESENEEEEEAVF